jgi:hypothetical protein
MTYNAKPCKYCGFIAERSSDEACPARLRNRWRRFLERMIDLLS